MCVFHVSAKSVYSAILPSTVTALTGCCVQIPCTFTIPDFDAKLQKTEQIYGTWLMKSPHFDGNKSLVVFNGSQHRIEGFSHIEMIGNLSERNCTTVFYNLMKNHSDSYYFRLHMEPNQFRATFNTNPGDSSDSSNTVKINVKDSPQLPELKVNPNWQWVKEGTEVSVRCSAEAPCPKQPPTLSWSYIPTSANVTTNFQEKPDKTQTVMSTMTFNASYILHKKNIICAATYPRNSSNHTTVEKNVTLQVLFSPKRTSINVRPSASVSRGTNVTLTCRSKASPSRNISFTWYKRGQETPVDWRNSITFTVNKNNTGWYSCTAQNTFGNQTSEEIQIIIKEHSGSSASWIYGCTGGLLTLLVLSAVGFYCVRSNVSSHFIKKARNQHTEDTNKNTIYSNNTVEMNMKREEDTDEIHYGEIDFSRKHPDQECVKVHGSETKTQFNRAQKEEELYAQVKTK